jgi:hypothetical protein
VRRAEHAAGGGCPGHGHDATAAAASPLTPDRLPAAAPCWPPRTPFPVPRALRPHGAATRRGAARVGAGMTSSLKWERGKSSGKAGRESRWLPANADRSSTKSRASSGRGLQQIGTPATARSGGPIEQSAAKGLSGVMPKHEA